jgi:hypothetical protein
MCCVRRKPWTWTTELLNHCMYSLSSPIDQQETPCCLCVIMETHHTILVLTNRLHTSVHLCICFALVPICNYLLWLCYSGSGSHILPVLGTISYAAALLCLWEALTQLWQDQRVGLLHHRSVVTFITFSLPAPIISLFTSSTTYVLADDMARLNISNSIISKIPSFNLLLMLW